MSAVSPVFHDIVARRGTFEAEPKSSATTLNEPVTPLGIYQVGVGMIPKLSITTENPEKVPEWVEPVLSKLCEILELQENWDSYGAHSIKVETAIDAIMMLSAIGDNIITPAVFPVCNGGVQLEWHSDGFDCEIEIEASGRVRIALDHSALGIDLDEEFKRVADVDLDRIRLNDLVSI